MSRSWIAFAVALFALAFAPSARADGFFVTITNSAGASTPRMAGAVFSATNGSDAVADSLGSMNEPTTHAVSQPGAAHLEIDAILGSAASIASVVGTPLVMGIAKPCTVKVEYTTPDATGQEQVYLVATLGTAAVTKWTTTYSAGPSEIQSLDLVYITEALGPPPSPKVKRVTPKDAPIVRRIMLHPTPAPAHDDDAYFSFQGFAGESTAAGHSGQTHATSVAVTLLWPITFQKSSLNFSFGIPSTSIKIVKAMGASTAAFVTAQSQGAIKAFNGTIQLVQHSTSGDTVRFTIQATNLWVQSDATQATSSGQTETIALPLKVPGSLTVTDATTGTSARAM